MADNKQLVVSKAETMKEYTPELMPFHISYDGPAPVSTYMKKEEKAESGEYKTTFRGRTLHGVGVVLPSGYSGLVLEREEEGRGVVAVGEFKGIDVWQADVGVDGGRDEYMRGLGEWTGLASEIHRDG